VKSESLLHKKGVFQVEVETRSEVGDQAKKKKERVRMQRAGQRECCGPES
jgi:hypothetical protein